MIDLTRGPDRRDRRRRAGRHHAGGGRTRTSPAPSSSTPAPSPPGGLFLALPGARSDGHDFAAAAVAPGAVAVLAARPVGVPAIVVPPAAATDARAGVLEHDPDGSGAAVLAALAKLAAAVAAELVAGGLTIIGVTGSSGKTSTKDLMAAVLRPLGEVVAPPGSFNNELGHPWTVLRATADTDILVLEMSARHPGNIAALAAIAPPSIAVVLNVGTAHLGEFGSREAIAETKAELAASSSGVRRGDPQRRRPVVAAMAERPRRGWCGSGGTDDSADVRAENVELDELARPRFTLCAGAGTIDIAAGRARRPPGVQRAVRGRGRAGMRGEPASGGRGAGGRGPGLAAPDGGADPRRRGDRHQRRL